MPDAPLRLAIVGCGAIAESLYLPALRDVAEFQVAAMVDADPGRAQAVANTLSVSCAVSSIDDVNVPVDAAILATPPHVRPAACAQALARGWHVLCEKPLANTVAECEAMSRAAAEAGRVAAAAHVYRFWPSRERVGDMIRSGEHGRLRTIHIEQGHPYSWQPVTGYTVRRELCSGGVLINAGIHPLDSLIAWLGDPIDFEYADDACGGLESNVRATFTFAGDVEVRFRQSRTCHLAEELVLEFDTAIVRLAANDFAGLMVHRDHEQQAWSSGLDRHDALAPARAMLRDFAQAIRHRSPPRVSLDEGTRVLRLIEACYDMKRRRPLPDKAPLPGLTW